MIRAAVFRKLYFKLKNRPTPAWEGRYILTVHVNEVLTSYNEGNYLCTLNTVYGETEKQANKW